MKLLRTQPEDFGNRFLQALIELVNALGMSGALNHGEATSLITKLTQAMHALAENPPDIFRAQERTLKFVEDVQKMIPTKLPASLGQALIDTANSIWDQLNGL